MNMGIFAKFNSQIDKEQLKKDIAEAKENQGGGVVEIPVGTYEVEVEKIECKETKKGDPMISIWFNILVGEHKGQKLFYNQVLQVGTKNLGWQINRAIDFIETLGADVPLTDKMDFEVLENWLMDTLDQIKDLGLEYEIEYSKDKKDFAVYKVKEIFEG